MFIIELTACIRLLGCKQLQALPAKLANTVCEHVQTRNALPMAGMQCRRHMQRLHTACPPNECSRKIYNKKKAQAGLEYIILLALLLAALVPIFIYSMDTSSVSIRTIQSREAVQRIANAADALYRLGGGKTTVYVYMPSGVESYSISQKIIKLTLRIGEGTGDIFARTEGDVSGTIVISEGYKNIPIRAFSNGTVVIG